jgi:DNA-binding NarL/FixJ family response regulator
MVGSPTVREDRGVTTLLLVDDHAAFRRGARRMLAAGGFEVVGDATTAEEAVVLALQLRPQVVLLDINLPDATGFDVCSRLADVGFVGAIILMSSRAAGDFGRLVEASGARGFVSKREISVRRIRELLR